MTSNAARATLTRALRAGLSRDLPVVAGLCTDDVRVWTPAFAADSLSGLLEELEHRDEVFSERELEVAPLDVGGDFAGAEWRVSMTHSGTLALETPDDAPTSSGDGIGSIRAKSVTGSIVTIEPTGIRVTVRGVTVAEFRGELICSVRQYWDESSVLEQLGVLARDN